MGDDITKCTGQIRQLYDPPRVNPENSYEFEDFIVPSSISPKFGYVASTAYLDLSIQGCNLTTGRSGRLGIRIADPTSITVGSGQLNIGIPVTGEKPWIGLGNIYYIPGDGVALGWFQTSSSPNPYAMLFAGGLVLLETILYSDCHDAQACGASFTSNLFQKALPINTLREIVQKIGIKTQVNACSNIWNHNTLAGCSAYAASYQKQGLFQVARDMVTAPLSKESDPYVRAYLMTKRDEILFNENMGGLSAFIGIFTSMTPITRRIARNIMKTTGEVNAFIDANSDWLNGKGGKRPANREIYAFMANALYLMTKLQISGKVTEKKFEIESSAPIAFENSDDIITFLQTISRAYQTISESQPLWEMIAIESVVAADYITRDGLEEHPTDSVINAFFTIDNLFNWTREMTTFNMPLLFEARKAHLIWMLNKRGGKDKASKIDTLKSIELGNVETMFATASEEIDRFFRHGLTSVTTVKEYDGLYLGLEYMFRLNQSKDPLTEVHGLDLTGAANEPNISEAFHYLFQFIIKERQGQTKEISGLGLHIHRQLQLLMKERRQDITDELEEYSETFGTRREKAFEAVLDIHRSVTELKELGKKSPMVQQLARDLQNLCLEAADLVNHIKDKGFENIDSILGTSSEDEQKFYELAGQIAKNLNVLVNIIHELNKNEATIEKLQKALQTLAIARSEFYSLSKFRAEVITMKLYLEEKIERPTINGK